MRKLFVILSFLILISCFTSQSWASPRMCRSVEFKDYCWGIKEFSNGVYSGFFRNDKPDGQGTKTYTDGKVEQGIWEDGKFMYEKKPDVGIRRYKSFCSEIGFTPGTEKFGKCVVEAMKKG